MSTYLVEHPGVGYLTLKSITIEPNGNIALNSEFSIEMDPANGCRLARDKAESLVQKLNKKEMHEKWRVVAYAVAYPDWLKEQNRKGKVP
jgi:hypothetical protein